MEISFFFRTSGSIEKILKIEKLWIKISDSIRSINKYSDGYDEKNMKIKCNSDNDLPLNKTIEIPKMTVVRAVFQENNKYYPQIFLDECLDKL